MEGCECRTKRNPSIGRSPSATPENLGKKKMVREGTLLKGFVEGRRGG